MEPNLQTALTSVIEQYNHCKLDCNISFHTTWLYCKDNDTEFRYCILAGKIIVSRICFTNKRSGCMTACFDILKQFASILGYSTIQIQSVLTYEMQQWCLKHNFIPDVFNMLIKDEQSRNVITGNYEYEIHKSERTEHHV